MTKTEILIELGEIIEDSFLIDRVIMSPDSRLSHFEPDETDLTMFLIEVDFQFGIDLGEEFPNLTEVPMGEIVDRISDRISDRLAGRFSEKQNTNN